MRLLRLLARVVVVASASFVILSLLLVLAVRLVVVPKVGDYRDEITAAIERGIGRKVSIGDSTRVGTVGARRCAWSTSSCMTRPATRPGTAEHRDVRPWRSVVIGEIRLRRLEVAGLNCWCAAIRRAHLRRRHGRGAIGGAAGFRSGGMVHQAATVLIRDGTVVWQDDCALPRRCGWSSESAARERRDPASLRPDRGAAGGAGRSSRPARRCCDSTLAKLQNTKGRVYARLDLSMSRKRNHGCRCRSSCAAAAARCALDGVRRQRAHRRHCRRRARRCPDPAEKQPARARPEHLNGRPAWRNAQGRTDFNTRGLELTTRNGNRLTPEMCDRVFGRKGDKAPSGEIKTGQLSSNRSSPGQHLRSTTSCACASEVCAGRCAETGRSHDRRCGQAAGLHAARAVPRRRVSPVDALPGSRG